MTRAQIVKGLLKLPGFAAWVVLTGGNPALFIDDDLLDGLSEYFKIAIETQGFTGFEQVECPEYIGYLVISPKPPSSGMSGRYTSSHFEYWKALIQKRYEVCRLTALKYVAFDDTDLEWIAEVDYQYGQHAERFISVGTPQDVESMTLPRLRDAVLDCTVDIVSRVLKDERFATFRVLPQLHTLLWGRKKGV
jgi:7-carboxy-7-deazaguanine synthase